MSKRAHSQLKIKADQNSVFSVNQVTMSLESDVINDLLSLGKDLIHCVLGLSMASDPDEDLVRTNLAGYIVM